MRLLHPASEDEMVACFLRGELASERWGAGVRAALAATGYGERLLTDADLADQDENAARRAALAATRGFGENRDVFEDFPPGVRWEWAMLTGEDLAAVRYIEYSYWNELSGGSRLASDAARRIEAGATVFDVPNDRFEEAAAALSRGETFPPLILAGESPHDLVCLEGNLRLTAFALASFPAEVECLLGTGPGLARWAR
jgi:hypothetical protein